jgi:hypothetical protein
MRVHAWVPSSCYSDPAETVGHLRAAGITVANLMVNDMSDKRGSTPFTTFSVDKINAMAKACRDAGVAVHLTVWAMPHLGYMQGALAVLPGLMASTGATLLMWDAEGPWVDATGDFDYAEAAEYAARCFPRLALSGIGSAPVELCELAKVCRVRSPQGYADDDGNGATPGGVVPYSIDCWTARYGEPVEGWIIGLAAYDQGTPAASTMQPPVDDVIAAGIGDVSYWTINSIADDPGVMAFVAGLTAPVAPAPVQVGGIFPRLDVLAMTRGTVSTQLRTVQGMLAAWGCDPGPLDGLPGTKTADGVKAFQEMRGLAASGVVDDATWCSLLRE